MSRSSQRRRKREVRSSKYQPVGPHDIVAPHVAKHIELAPSDWHSASVVHVIEQYVPMVVHAPPSAGNIANGRHSPVTHSLPFTQDSPAPFVPGAAASDALAASLVFGVGSTVLPLHAAIANAKKVPATTRRKSLFMIRSLDAPFEAVNIAPYESMTSQESF
jgi:hypothetical protein